MRPPPSPLFDILNYNYLFLTIYRSLEAKYSDIRVLIIDVERHVRLADQVPEVTFKTRVRDDSIEGPNPVRWENKTSRDLFAARNVVVCSLPGAFTPTCSSNHLPRYDELAEEFKTQGVDEIICVAVNDATELSWMVNQWN